MDPYSSDRQIEFLTNLQMLLSEISFVATAKYAILLSLAEHALGTGDDNCLPLEAPVTRIPELFMAHSWSQAGPFTETA